MMERTDLTRSQKKIARAVIDKGLSKHYERALAEAEQVCTKWREGGFTNNREAYISLFQCVDSNDKNITWLYDGLSPTRWVQLMSQQLAEGVIIVDDLVEFDEEVRSTIIQLSKQNS